MEGYLEGNKEAEHDKCRKEDELLSDKTEVSDTRQVPNISRIYLWYFLLDLLHLNNTTHIVKWIDVEQLIFQIMNPTKLAALWGGLRGFQTMNYQKLARCIRHYYNKGVLRKVQGKHYQYQFIRTEKLVSVMAYMKDR